MSCTCSLDRDKCIVQFDRNMMESGLLKCEVESGRIIFR
jgi:hypothetical protein